MRTFVYFCVIVWLLFLPAAYSRASETTIEATLNIGGDYQMIIEGLPDGVGDMGAIAVKHPDLLAISIVQDEHVYVSDLTVTEKGTLEPESEISASSISADQSIIVSIF